MADAPTFFDPTPEEKRTLEKLVDEIPGIQRTLVDNHPQLASADRGAHQQQIAGGKVLLRVADTLPAELDGLGVFQRTPGASEYVGLGRISTGLGCPHSETAPDFLGVMLAFRSRSGRRNDFIGINDPTAPTDTPEEFISLLKATADAAGAGIPNAHNAVNMFASQATLLLSLARHAGLRAPAIATHVVAQTSRTSRSSSAYQAYWTGVIRARDGLGKFTLVPTADLNTGRPDGAGPTYLSDDWRHLQSTHPLEFRLYWIPFVREEATPVVRLTRAWNEDHRVQVGTVTFPKMNADSPEAKLAALLAQEMGANTGNWLETPESQGSDLPSTRYTAARSLVYRRSQAERHALPEESYASFFERGEVSPELATELLQRHERKRAVGHGGINVD